MWKRLLKFLGLLFLTSFVLVIILILVLFKIGVFRSYSPLELASLENDSLQVEMTFDEGSVVNMEKEPETLFGGFVSGESGDLRDTVIFGDVVDVLAENKRMGISVNLPEEIKDIIGYKVFDVRCLEDKTDLVSADNQRLIRSDIDVFSFAESGDYIYAYCLDSGCDTIGGECVLVK